VTKAIFNYLCISVQQTFPAQEPFDNTPKTATVAKTLSSKGPIFQAKCILY
jgi:hypothetical protein